MYFTPVNTKGTFPRVRRLAIKLRPIAEKKVKQGHPWVFSKSIAKLNKKGKPGDLAILFSQNDNQVYAIGLYDPKSPIRIKIIHFNGSKNIDYQFFKNKIIKAFKIRKPLFEHNTNAYRLIFGENDGFPGLIVDVYSQVGVVKLYSEIWLPYLDILVDQVVNIAKLKSIVLRLSRMLQKLDLPLKEGDILYGYLKDPEIRFQEYGVHFQTHLLSGHKTGFFLDHRANRHKVGQLSRGKEVLDVFSYAGSFSVHALVGGAKEVISIDISKQALQLATINVELNNPPGKHKALAGDAFNLLKKLIRESRQFDIVVIDPPSFAKSKKEIEGARKKYAELAMLGAQLTKKEGLLLLSSCSSRLNADEFLELHKTEFRRLNVNYTLESLTLHDIDHPVRFEEGRYLKTAYYKIH